MDDNTAISLRYAIAAVCIVVLIIYGQISAASVVAFITGILVPTEHLTQAIA